MRNVYEIEIIDWSQYNPVKMKGTWFRCSAYLFGDNTFKGLSRTSKLVWLWLLCERAKVSRETVTMVPAVLQRELHSKPRGLIAAIHELEESKFIRVVNVKKTTTRALTTNETNERDETYETNVPRGGTKPNPRQARGTPAASGGIPAEAHASAPAKKPKPVVSTEAQDLRKRCWESYAKAYEARWGVTPVRNATVNAQIATLASRLGGEAPDVLTFYVGHKDGFYVKKAHPVGLCLKDAESLRTQWMKGIQITGAKVRDFEKGQAQQDLLERIEREGV